MITVAQMLICYQTQVGKCSVEIQVWLYRPICYPSAVDLLFSASCDDIGCLSFMFCFEEKHVYVSLIVWTTACPLLADFYEVLSCCGI